jgi:hypothetical protein
MIRQTTTSLLAIAIGLCLLAGAAHAKSFPPETLIGEWQGDGKIIVTWCKQGRLQFHIFVRADARVSGSVGDAVITEGVIKKNHWFLDWLGNPEYVIEAKLRGPVVAPEGIQRESIIILVDLVHHELQGGFHTSGAKVGGKDSMVLSGTSVTLSKVQSLEPEIGQVRVRELVGQ